MNIKNSCNMNLDDIQRIWTAAYNKTPNMMAYAVLLSIESGMSAAEIVALQWDNIKDDCIYVPYSKNGYGNKRTGRYIPFTPSLKSLLDLIRTSSYTNDYVIAVGGCPIAKSSYRRYLTRLTNRLGYHITSNNVFRLAYNGYLD